MDGQNLTKFCLHIIIDKIYIAIVSVPYLYVSVCFKKRLAHFFFLNRKSHNDMTDTFIWND